MRGIRRFIWGEEVIKRIEEKRRRTKGRYIYVNDLNINNNPKSLWEQYL
jgi:hypothetical protein